MQSSNQFLEKMPTISQAAADEYLQKSMLLIEYLNHAIEKENESVIGEVPLGLLYRNHINHTQFMGNIFNFNVYSILYETLPWVYKVYYIQGVPYQYFLTALKLWKKGIQTHLSNENATEICNAYQVLIDTHQDTITRSQNLQSFSATQETSQLSHIQKDFLFAVLAGDFEKSFEMVNECLKDNSLKEVYLNIVQTTMYQVGRSWENGEITSAHEHIASAIVSQIMSFLSLREHKKKHDNPKTILVTTITNEFHELGAWMICDLMRMQGHQVTYIGVNPNHEDLVNYLQKKQFDYVAISSTMPTNLVNVADVITSIKTTVQNKTPKIILGGQAFKNFNNAENSFKADYVFNNIEQLLALLEHNG